MIHRPALTKLEFLVVCALALFAVGFGVVLIARHRENAMRVECTNNLRVVGLAFHAYHDASSADEKRQYLPPARIANGFATWAVLLAPHLLKDHPLHQWDVKKSYFAQTEEARQARVFVYFCPARRRADALSLAGDVDKDNHHFPGGLGDYAAVAGDGSADHDWTGAGADGALISAGNLQRQGDLIVHWDSQTSLASLTRGTQYTLLVGEKHVPPDRLGNAAAGDGSLYNGANPASFARVAGPGFPLARAIDEPVNKNFGSYHNGVCQFLMADASVRAMTNNTSENVLGALARRGD